jgi:hypothetical protein
LLHDNTPAHKAAKFLPIFDSRKCNNPLSRPFSPDLSQTDYFLIPKLRIELKGLHFADVAEIQETVTDELKKVQNEEISAIFFRNCTTSQKPVYMPMEIILNLKKRYVSSACVFD